MSFILEEVEEEAGEDEGSESGGSGSGNSASTGRTVQQRPTPMSALSRARTASAPTDALSMRTASGSGSGSILRRGYVAGTGSRTASIYSGVSGTSSSRHSFNSYQTSGRRVLIPSPLPGINGQSHILSASSASLPTRSSTPHSSLPNGSLTASSVYSPSAFGGIYRAYSSLVLPRAAFTPSKHPDRVSSQIDITKSGLAQTSMATVEVRRGAAEALLRGSVGSGGTKGGLVGLTRLSVFGGLGSLNGKGNRMSGLFSSSSSGGGIRGRTMKIGGGGSGGRASRSLEMPGHLREKLKMDSPSPLAFSVHTPPPNKLTSGQVLVQVFMVGLDWLDALVVKEKVEGSGGGDVGGGRGEGCGFVPGRSFVGRTVEVGFEVRNVCKGDWVFGLLDLGKCGALAEFIIVDRRRVHRAPNLMHSDLHLEQVASLPLSGVPTHRAIRTLPNVVKGKKALVLNAHDGAGALMVQVLCSHDVIVTAQVPAGSGVGLRALGSMQNGRGGKGNATSSSKSEGHQVEEVEQSEEEEEGEKISTFEERAKMYGASRVMVGDPLVVIAECKEGEFDYVLDTVGGKRIWEASGWVLKSGGQFTTLVGDAPDIVPYTSSNFKSNLRSIQGALKRKKGYEWVMPNAELDTEGEDVRDALGSVAKMAEAGLMVPWCKQGVKFERTADVFGEGVSARLFEGGGVVVSKIIG
ncbi:uncharacterized protein EI90DRAFT_2457861 [Cantharellus anzutake]|uniref:uncharacterized protein n=1 Tax=Cantharellus anzutake TaxID=1750568 RepID=UPI001903647F|nr:uncharacterized protein EI90DRAFT_2457861 [Cantharellus anzutake]KAF8339100.1 hypothetical protein EI90DRAFT_2457861 [Cantharellus anzutake]